MDKPAQAEAFLGEVLAKMGFAARLEVKETADKPAAEGQPALPGAISVAVFPEGEWPGLTAGKRTPVVEALQFLANKVVNRGPEKKWVNLGVGGHPEPRVPGQRRQREPPPPKEPRKARPVANGEDRPEAPPRRERQKEPRAERPAAARPPREADEATLEVPPDPAFSALGTSLAQRSAQLGRLYAVVGLNAEDRARLLRAAESVDFVRAKVEGEGKYRRVVLMPANPKPMPKKSHMPDYDDEDEDLEE